MLMNNPPVRAHVLLGCLLAGSTLLLLASGYAETQASKSQGKQKAAPAPVTKATPEKLDYNRDIRPILAAKCFTCHGSDEKSRQAALRLDGRAEATRKLADGQYAIVPGKPQQSALVQRINALGAPSQMPPASSQKTLTDAERATLTRWVAEGAEYKPHWAFVKPVRPPLPRVKLTTWPRNPIDYFVLARLEKEGLKPSPTADRITLIRRLSLDLIGIPPTPEEVDAFVADKSYNAYENLVDRLLASPHYGERMALNWLDTARYADSNGYQADYERFQWRWRDWVLDAFNNNMHFDEFTIEQLAGDLLPNATLSQKIATGFNRNHRINTEGGAIPEEWRVENVIDRVETTSATWLGLTMGCARCHDHKYDPISQKEFYQFFSYFNNIPEAGTGIEQPINQPPIIQAPTPPQQAALALLDIKRKDLEAQQKTLLAADAPRAAVWMQTPDLQENGLTLQDGLVARYLLTSPPSLLAGKAPAPQAVGAVGYDAGHTTGAVITHGTDFLDLGDVGDFDLHDRFSYGGWIYPMKGDGSPLSRMDSKGDYRGWDIFLSGGHVEVHLIHKWPDNALKVATKQPIPLNQWSHILVTYDGSAQPRGILIFVNGIPVPTTMEANTLTDTIRTHVTAKIGTRTGSDGFNGKVEDAFLYRRVLGLGEATRLTSGDPARPLLAIPPAQRTEAQKLRLLQLWAKINDAQYKTVTDGLDEVVKSRTDILDHTSTLMVMEEMPTPRDCYVLVRGQYDKHGEKVTAGLPAAFPPLPPGAPNNRLGLARWIASPDNPLTARVAVNRFWEKFFGIGIVSTSEDFGTRAEFPSHPELLDWLATEFVRLGWDMKAIQKEIVMSATYRQSSRVTPELLRRDPENRLLTRGPRFRLPGELIRDQALAVSKLLMEKLGGPSVRPYQPDGVWDETNVFGNLRNYHHDKGEGLYRRSLYTIWKRTAAPPTMLLFDVPSRETCRVRRTRTDTPLQALALLNETTFVEASRVLAQHTLSEGGPTPESRIVYAYRQVLCRKPTPDEIRILSSGLQSRLTYYRAHLDEAQKLIAVGDTPSGPGYAPPELAAYTMMANVLLNLDETITKE